MGRTGRKSNLKGSWELEIGNIKPVISSRKLSVGL